MSRQKIGIFLDVNFKNFDKYDRDNFLKDLSKIVGCLQSEIENPRFWAGCVKFEGELDQEAAQYILETFESARSGSINDNSPESLKRFLDFLKKYKIRAIEDGGLSAKIVMTMHTDVMQKDIAVFVHGWRGDKESFGRLPEFISNNNDMASEIYEYKTQALGEVPSILYVAQNLENWVRNKLRDRGQRVAFVAHSMGGLVVRRVLANQCYRKFPLDERIRHVTFIASPHTGVWIAKLSKFLGGLQSIQTSELRPDSPILVELIQNWSAWIDRFGARKSVIRSIYGTEDAIVDPAIAIGCDPEAIPILGAHHRDICNANNNTDEIVQTICRLLRESK